MKVYTFETERTAGISYISPSLTEAELNYLRTSSKLHVVIHDQVGSRFSVFGKELFNWQEPLITLLYKNIIWILSVIPVLLKNIPKAP